MFWNCICSGCAPLCLQLLQLPTHLSVASSHRWSAFSNPGHWLCHRLWTLVFNTKTAISFQNYQLKVSILCFHQGLSVQVFRLHIPDIRFYNEIMLGIGFSRNFSDKFSLGVQLDYYAAYFAASDKKILRSVFSSDRIKCQPFTRFHLGFLPSTLFNQS